jgi:hypothetical protein
MTATLLVGTASAPAVAATPAEDVAAAQAQLVQLRADTEAAAAALSGSTAAAGEAEQKLATVEAQAAEARDRLTAARSESGRLASAAYRQGGVITGALHLMLSDDSGRLDADSSYLRARLQAQGGSVRRTEQEGAGLQAQRDALAQQTSQLQAERDAAAARHAGTQAAVADADRRLVALQAAERAAVEAARAEAAQAASRSAARTAAPAPAAPASRAAAPAAPAAPAGPAPVAAGSCPPSGGRGAEARLTPATLRVMRCGLAAFPQIQTAGGWGTRGNATDHDDGRAVDFMIPAYSSAGGNALGWAVARWAAAQPGVDYVMFDGKQWGSWAPGRGWTSVGNRGSDTANHLDHVHVSVKG